MSFNVCDALVSFVQFKQREKNTEEGVLLLVKFQVSFCNFTKSNIPPWVFFTFLNLYKWYQIVQNVSYLAIAQRFSVKPLLKMSIHKIFWPQSRIGLGVLSETAEAYL